MHGFGNLNLWQGGSALDSFNILSLFDGGANNGALLDLSTLSGVVYEDDDLTTATAGDPAGLIIPFGGNPFTGSQLAANPDFSSGVTDWTVGSGVTAAESGGVVTLTALSSGVREFKQSISGLEIDKLYKITITIDAVGVDSGNCSLTLFNESVTFGNTPGTYTYYRRASAVSRLIGVAVAGAASAGGTLAVSHIGCEEAGEIWNQFTGAARPTVRNDGTHNYLEFDGTSDILETGSGRLDLNAKKMLFGYALNSSDAQGPLWGTTQADNLIYGYSTTGSPSLGFTINDVWANGVLDATGAKTDREALSDLYTGGKKTIIIEATADASITRPGANESWHFGYSGSFSGFYWGGDLYAMAWVARDVEPTAQEVAGLHAWLSARI